MDPSDENIREPKFIEHLGEKSLVEGVKDFSYIY